MPTKSAKCGDVRIEVIDMVRGEVGMRKLLVKRLDSAALLPTRPKDGDAGLDLYCLEAVHIAPGERKVIRTGLAIELPHGTEGQIRPRSGLALSHGVTVLNGPGTIDAGYRGEILVLLINHGAEMVDLEAASRIAQIVVSPVITVNVEEAPQLSPTERSSDGFGSTGR